MMKSIPSVEVSRLALVLLVAAGVAVAVSGTGDLSHFAAGFAAGAGAALVLSRMRRAPDEPASGGEDPI